MMLTGKQTLGQTFCLILTYLSGLLWGRKGEGDTSGLELLEGREGYKYSKNYMHASFMCKVTEAPKDLARRELSRLEHFPETFATERSYALQNKERATLLPSTAEIGFL